MPPTFTGNAGTPSQSPRSLEMEVAAGSSGRRSGGQTQTQEQAIAQPTAKGQTRLDKQSLSYVLRSGLAGGLAGCAVSYPYSEVVNKEPTMLVGQNSRGSSRPRENPLPSIQSPICEVHWLLVRRHDSNAGYQQARWYSRSVPWSLRNTAPHLPLCSHKISSLRANPLSCYKG